MLVGAFNQEKALVGAFSVITSLRMELFQALELAILYKAVTVSAGDRNPDNVRCSSSSSARCGFCRARAIMGSLTTTQTRNVGHKTPGRQQLVFVSV